MQATDKIAPVTAVVLVTFVFVLKLPSKTEKNSSSHAKQTSKTLDKPSRQPMKIELDYNGPRATQKAESKLGWLQA